MMIMACHYATSLPQHGWLASAGLPLSCWPITTLPACLFVTTSAAAIVIKMIIVRCQYLQSTYFSLSCKLMSSS
jgi:hypothetical protein